MTFRENLVGFRGTIFIRIAVGLIFSTQGILKYIDPKMGVERFTRIGFPHPYFTAHLVGTFEIVCGALVLLGLWRGQHPFHCSLSSRPRSPQRKSRNYFAPPKVSGTWLVTHAKIS